MEREGFKPFGKGADGLRIVVGLDVAPRAGDGDAVEQLKEIEVQGGEDSRSGAVGRRQFGPCVERGLGAAENLVDVFADLELRAETLGFALIGEGQLVFEIGEAVVHRSRGEHEDFGLHALAHDLV